MARSIFFSFSLIRRPINKNDVVIFVSVEFHIENNSKKSVPRCYFEEEMDWSQLLLLISEYYIHSLIT